eukprot:9500733-Pyramimonas_sp.AAC.1
MRLIEIDADDSIDSLPLEYAHLPGGCIHFDVLFERMCTQREAMMGQQPSKDKRQHADLSTMQEQTSRKANHAHTPLTFALTKIG